MPAGAIAAAGRFGAHPYFPEADWLWRPIPASPVLDANSTTWVGYLSAGGTQHVCDIIEFGVALRGPGGSTGSAVTASTPKYDVTFANVPAWGPDPHSLTMAIPDDVVVPGIALGPTVYDGHVATADPSRAVVHSVWRGVDNGATWNASWGRQTPLYGDGRESGSASSGSSTGARLSRYAGVVRSSEMTAAHAAGDIAIPHALFFSTDIASAAVRYPASVGDGANGRGVATPIPEGARIQLDPSVNLAGISGMTAWELIIGRTLQKYGAYVGDNGGACMAFLFEYLGEGTTPNQPYLDVYSGIFDYFDMTHIPWSNLRVLQQWDGL